MSPVKSYSEIQNNYSKSCVLPEIGLLVAWNGYLELWELRIANITNIQMYVGRLSVGQVVGKVSWVLFLT